MYRNSIHSFVYPPTPDLRKLIKFDTRADASATNREALKQSAQQMNTFQRLHTLTTISYDAKLAKKAVSKPTSAAPSEMAVSTEQVNTARIEPQGNNDDKENQQERGKSKKLPKEQQTGSNKMCML